MCLERVTCSPPGNRKLMCTKRMNENVAISYMASIKTEYFFYLKISNWPKVSCTETAEILVWGH